MADNFFMREALAQAEQAGTRGEVPIGAVIVCDGKIIAKAGNRTLELNDPTAHAEMLAIRAAGTHLASQRLTGCDLYVTLEPCTMCAAALSFARIRRIYFAVADEKGGGVEHGARFFDQPTCHHKPEVITGLNEEQARTLLTQFFKARR